MTDSLTILVDGAPVGVTLAPKDTALVDFGTRGPKGDPGGTTMAVGTLAEAMAMDIEASGPVGTIWTDDRGRYVKAGADEPPTQAEVAYGWAFTDSTGAKHWRKPEEREVRLSEWGFVTHRDFDVDPVSLTFGLPVGTVVDQQPRLQALFYYIAQRFGSGKAVHDLPGTLMLGASTIIPIGVSFDAINAPISVRGAQAAALTTPPAYTSKDLDGTTDLPSYARSTAWADTSNIMPIAGGTYYTRTGATVTHNPADPTSTCNAGFLFFCNIDPSINPNTWLQQYPSVGSGTMEHLYYDGWPTNGIGGFWFAGSHHFKSIRCYGSSTVIGKPNLYCDNVVIEDIDCQERTSGIEDFGILTATANFADGDAVVIDTWYYFFRATLTDVEGNVAIGATLADSLANLAAAVNLGPGAGTAYAASMPAHDTMTATSDATTLTLAAIDPAYNTTSIEVSTTAASASWSERYFAVYLNGLGDGCRIRYVAPGYKNDQDGITYGVFVQLARGIEVSGLVNGVNWYSEGTAIEVSAVHCEGGQQVVRGSFTTFNTSHLHNGKGHLCPIIVRNDGAIYSLGSARVGVNDTVFAHHANDAGGYVSGTTGWADTPCIDIMLVDNKAEIHGNGGNRRIATLSGNNDRKYSHAPLVGFGSAVLADWLHHAPMLACKPWSVMWGTVVIDGKKPSRLTNWEGPNPGATRITGSTRFQGTPAIRRYTMLPMQDYSRRIGRVPTALTASYCRIVCTDHAMGVLDIYVNLTNGRTVTIGSKVYTLQTTLTDVDGHVLLGADQTETAANLAAAINLGAGAGTVYAASTTAHPSVTATAILGQLYAVAIASGTPSPAIALATSADDDPGDITWAADASWNASELGFMLPGFYPDAQPDNTGAMLWEVYCSSTDTDNYDLRALVPTINDQMFIDNGDALNSFAWESITPLTIAQIQASVNNNGWAGPVDYTDGIATIRTADAALAGAAPNVTGGIFRKGDTALFEGATPNAVGRRAASITCRTAGTYGAGDPVFDTNYTQSHASGMPTIAITDLPAASTGIAGAEYLVAFGSGAATIVMKATCTGYSWQFTRTLLGLSTVPLSHTGDTLPTSLLSLTLPARMLGANGQLDIVHEWALTGSGNKTMSIKLGTATIFSNTQTTAAQCRALTTVRNQDDQALQRYVFSAVFGSFGTGSGSVGAAAVDTSGNLTLDFRAQLVTIGDSIALEGFEAFVQRKD